MKTNETQSTVTNTQVNTGILQITYAADCDDVAFFETQLFIEKEFVMVLAESKTWDKSLAEHKKFVKIMRSIVKNNV